MSMLLAALATATVMPLTPLSEQPYKSGVFKFCDEGRAIYIYSDYRAGSMAVVPNAPECVGKLPPIQPPKPVVRDPKGRAPDLLGKRK